jgi:uncharacterized protein (DUF3820 family)
MNTKLTLTIEQTIIARAKKYAKQKGRSLSDIIENYLKVIAREDTSTDIKITPLIKSLRGSFKTPPDFDYKKELSASLQKKYMENE